MTKQISIKLKFGWVSVFENGGKIFKVKFGKLNKQTPNKSLLILKKKLLNFFGKKTLNIKAPYKIEGSKIQKNIWMKLRKIQTIIINTFHRVIRSDGGLKGFTSVGGVNLKKNY